MSKIIKIYCEGKSGSHDFDILEKVIADLVNAQIQITPIGGVRGAKAIIQYKESSSLVKSDFYLFFRDRDFDKPVPDLVCLEKDNYVYFSYRNTIENYLFSPIQLFNFIENKGLTKKYGIFTENDAKGKLIEAAEKIKYYQAVRHAMGEMRTDKTNFGTKLTEKSGILPTNLEQDFCRKMALEKIKDAKAYSEKWTEENFDLIFNNFLHKFNDVFMSNLDFLIYFQGKDFAKAITLILKDFALADYYKFAKDNFDYNQFGDLVELRNVLSKV